MKGVVETKRTRPSLQGRNYIEVCSWKTSERNWGLVVVFPILEDLEPLSGILFLQGYCGMIVC